MFSNLRIVFCRFVLIPFGAAEMSTKETFKSDIFKLWYNGNKEERSLEQPIQGLELDYSVVAWDADYRYVDGEWTYNNFVGHHWTNVSSEERRLYLKNAYRVLLTRARQGMAIFVPTGSDEDQTRKREWYNGIYNYLREIGITEL